MRILEPRSRESWNRDRWHRAWPAIDGTVRGHCERFWVLSDDLHVTNRHKRCRRESHGSGVFPVWRFPVSVVGRPVSGVRGPHAIDGTVRGPLFLIAQTSLCAVFAAISAKTRQNLAVGGLCGLSCFRPSFRIVLADVCGPGCRQTSLCAVFAKIAFSPTRNTKSNTNNRPLSNDMLYFILLNNTCSRLRETLL